MGISHILSVLYNYIGHLTLIMLICFKYHKRCIHISYHILDFVQQKKTKFTMAELHMLPIIYWQYHAYLCYGAQSRQSISR